MLAAIGLFAKSIGGPLGEPVAEDFDFLRRALLEAGSWWDGGGSKLFWRPVAHQLYFGILGRAILAHPAWITGLNLGLLTLAALLVYRALRDTWPRPWAAVAAGFPLLTEGARTLLLWPCNFADLGAILLTAVCLHEVCRRRLPTALVALALALGCKETSVIAGLLLPWIPSAGPRGVRERVRWAGAFGVVMLVWAIAYVIVRRTSGLHLPIEAGPVSAVAAGEWLERIRWALANGARAQLNLPVAGRMSDWVWVGAFAALCAVAAGFAIARAGPRARLARSAPIALWGLAWFMAAASATSTVHPLWMPYRAAYAGVGLGAAIGAVLGSVHPALLAGAVAIKLLTFAVSPAPPSFVASRLDGSGSFLDFESLVRLQRLMRDSRAALAEGIPRMPPGSTVAYFYLPKRTEYAFGGSSALQVWYRDPTLRFTSLPAAWADSSAQVVAVLAFEPHDEGPSEGERSEAGSGSTRHGSQVVLLDPAVLDLYFEAGTAMTAEDWSRALGLLGRAGEGARASSLLAASIAGAEAVCLEGLERHGEARDHAHRSVDLWPACPDGLYSLAWIDFREGRYDAAESSLATLRSRSPSDPRGPRLHEQLLHARNHIGRERGVDRVARK